MSVSLDYCSTKPVSAAKYRDLLTLTMAANDAYDWWCESIWISESLDEQGNAYGFTKPFCMIDDEDTDAYMAYLDICEIVRFLTSIAEKLGIEWRVGMEGSLFGVVTATGPDAELLGNLSGFLDVFLGDFESFRSRPREEILAEWDDR